MKVFVTGGTGAIGKYTVPALVGAGHDVTALARTPEKAAELAAVGATPVSVSLFDSDALTEVFAGHDAVANLATKMPPLPLFMSVRAWGPTERVRTEGSAAVVDAALAAGVPRLIQESVSVLYRDNGSDWVDEDSPVEHYRITRGNFAAEASAHRFADAGGTAVVLRFGIFLGATASNSEAMLALARRHISPVLGMPSGYSPSIHLADAATAVVAALDAPGGTYNIVDDAPLTNREYGDAATAAVHTTPWLRAPGRATVLAAGRLTSLTRSLRVSNTRFREATGWAPRYPSAREGWIATAEGLGLR